MYTESVVIFGSALKTPVLFIMFNFSEIYSRFEANITAYICTFEFEEKNITFWLPENKFVHKCNKIIVFNAALLKVMYMVHNFQGLRLSILLGWFTPISSSQILANAQYLVSPGYLTLIRYKQFYIFTISVINISDYILNITVL